MCKEAAPKARARTFIAPPVRGICRVMSARRPSQVHGESNNYVFPLSSCLCVWSKHNVMAKRSRSQPRSAAARWVSLAANPPRRVARVGVLAAVRKGACVEPGRRIMLFSQLRFILGELADYIFLLVSRCCAQEEQDAVPNRDHVRLLSQFFNFFYFFLVFKT